MCGEHAEGEQERHSIGFSTCSSEGVKAEALAAHNAQRAEVGEIYAESRRERVRKEKEKRGNHDPHPSRRRIALLKGCKVKKRQL